MNAREFEDEVATVIAEFESLRGGVISRNQRIPGVRQPGAYEIDILIDWSLDGVATLRLMVECKNWKRRVDRPAVQKVAQTREAIAAHKAVMVSPVGFSPEATAVAKAHGIALWILADKRVVCVLAKRMAHLIGYPSGGQRERKQLFLAMRANLVRALLVRDVNQRDRVLVDSEAAHRLRRSDSNGSERSSFDYTCSNLADHGQNKVGVDGRTGIATLVNWAATDLIEGRNLQELSAGGPAICWLKEAHARLSHNCVSEQAARAALDAVASNDARAFDKALHSWNHRHPGFTDEFLGRPTIDDTLEWCRLFSKLGKTPTFTGNIERRYRDLLVDGSELEYIRVTLERENARVAPDQRSTQLSEE